MRNEPNLLFVHYNDLKADLGGEMRRVAAFLDIADSRVASGPPSSSAARSSRCAMSNPTRTRCRWAFEGGVKGFIFKGTNGRWRDVLTDDEVAAYQRRVAEALPDECARWIEFGRGATG